MRYRILLVLFLAALFGFYAGMLDSALEVVHNATVYKGDL